MIRKLKKCDLKEFKNVCNEYKKNFSHLYNLDNIINDNVNKLYIYEKNHEIIGFILVEETFEILSIIHLYIKNEYRCKGFASLLIDFVLSNVNIERVILEVQVDNLPAIGLYKKHGFNIISVRKKYYNGIDAYVMEKRIYNEKC